MKAKRVIIFIHGLTGSAFSARNIVDAFLDSQTAVITFNNRGFGNVNKVKRKVGKESTSIWAGGAHEVFTESADDVQGVVNFVRRTGVKNIYLVGHSTGCQKSTYWASTTGGGGVRGIILLGPVSDYAVGRKRRNMVRAVSVARAMAKSGRKHELMPVEYRVPGFIDDAQRFLSLYTPDSVEEIFSYSQAKKTPKILRSVRVPILVVWAQKDEYTDRPAEVIVKWFDQNIRSKHLVIVVPNVGHGFKGGEGMVAGAIRNFMKECSL